MIEEKTYEYKFIHPVNGNYLSIKLYDEKSLRDWKPYLDVVEKWFLDKALDKAYDKLFFNSSERSVSG